jgi:hypothetical protein
VAFTTPALAFPTNARIVSRTVSSCASASTLPDSLEDAARIAARATAEFATASGPLARARVDFDTTVGDETYPLLKTSAEFTQQFCLALATLLIPTVVVEQIQQQSDGKPDSETDSTVDIPAKGRKKTLKPGPIYTGPVVRVYFPDEGNAALARRDWTSKLPPCFQFSSCGGVQIQDVSNDQIVLFYCPRGMHVGKRFAVKSVSLALTDSLIHSLAASEAESLEALLMKTEQKASNLLLTCLINPVLVDMGVTGFGMAGRRLRERLLTPLVTTYYLRTLAWGALTRAYPDAFSVWQEDARENGGYRLIKTLDQLPSNPDVEDIYDIENGNAEERRGGGLLEQVGDFINGMMRL